MAETAEILKERRAAAIAEKAASEAEIAASKIRSKTPAKSPWTARSGDVLNPATPGGTGSAAFLVLVAGAIAFFGNMKADKAFPVAGVRIITATLLLAIVMSLFDNGRLSPVARGLGYLMVLTALINYVPKFSKKGKTNG